MLVADIASDAAQSVLFDAADLFDEPETLSILFDGLAERVANVLHNEGIADPHIDSQLDMRYSGQSYELTVPLSIAGQRRNICRKQLTPSTAPTRCATATPCKKSASRSSPCACAPAVPEPGPRCPAARSNRPMPARHDWRTNKSGSRADRPT